MKSYSLYILTSFLLITAMACNQVKPMNVGPLTLSSSKPYLGEKITFQYKSDSTKFDGLKNLAGTLYYAINTKLYANSISMTDSNGTWHGTFTIPDSAQAFALKFNSDNKSDANDGKGYIFPVYTHSGKTVIGALAAESGFYFGIGSFLLKIKNNPDTALALMEKEFRNHPDLKNKWQSDYVRVLLTVKKDTAYPEVSGMVKTMLTQNPANEKTYMKAYSYLNQIHKMKQADSLKKIIYKKYPNGMLIRQVKFNAFSQQKNLDSLVTLYDQFKQQFVSETKDKTLSAMESNMSYQIAVAYGNKGRFDKFRFYASKVTNKLSLANIYNQIAWNLVMKGKHLTYADSLSRESMNLVQYVMDHPGDLKPTDYTNSQWKQVLKQSYGNDADTYAVILKKKRKYKEALSYEKTAVKYMHASNFGMNTSLVELFYKTGHIDSAKSSAEKFIEEGKSTPDMVTFLKTIYTNQHHSVNGFDNYISSLETKADNKLKAKLKKEIIDKPAPNFDLTDLKGNQVSLDSLHGKVVVVDFWATWCGPCKASFPAMQKVVNQFKGDKNVVFLFVDTWEHTKPAVRFKQVSDFIAKHKYPFRILLDKRQPKDSTQYQIVSAYGVNGIPTKFVIDPEGNIRFKSVGYMGNMDSMVKEVSDMIAMAKAN